MSDQPAPPPPDLPSQALMNPLELRLQYKFRNSLYLAEALTHPSLGHETQRHHFDNQRLEFLGDAVLQLVFTEHLFQRFPSFSEGQLTKMRSRLVSREGLKVHAVSIGLGEYLMMGRGEESSGGRVRASALADAFEALIGAMYLDSDLDAVRRFVLREAEPDIQNLLHEPVSVNPKAGFRNCCNRFHRAVRRIRSSGSPVRSTRSISNRSCGGWISSWAVEPARARKRRRSLRRLTPCRAAAGKRCGIRLSRQHRQAAATTPPCAG